jgi:uncharacterized SAM-dependent methyltransferase
MNEKDPLLHEVLEGLMSNPKTLPPELFYDEPGSRLFEQISSLPEYYLTRAETALLDRHGRKSLPSSLAVMIIRSCSLNRAAGQARRRLRSSDTSPAGSLWASTCPRTR